MTQEFQDLTERGLRSETIFDGKILHIRRDTVALPNGKTATREYTAHGGAVCVLPLLDNEDVLLERQYRYPLGQELIEIPAGKLDAPDEDRRQAALRELREETGISLPEHAFHQIRICDDDRIASYRDGTVWRMIIVLFSAELGDEPAIRCSRESTELRFFAPDELNLDDIVITHRDLVAMWVKQNRSDA